MSELRNEIEMQQSSSYSAADLPDVVLHDIFAMLPLGSRFAVGQVCSKFRRISRSDRRLWRKTCFSNYVKRNKGDDLHWKLFSTVVPMVPIDSEIHYYGSGENLSNSLALLSSSCYPTVPCTTLALSLDRNRNLLDEQLGQNIAAAFPWLSKLTVKGGFDNNFVKGLKPLSKTLKALHLCDVQSDFESITHLADYFPLLTDFKLKAEDDLPYSIYPSLVKLISQLKKCTIFDVDFVCLAKQLQGQTFPSVSELSLHSIRREMPDDFMSNDFVWKSILASFPVVKKLRLDGCGGFDCNADMAKAIPNLSRHLEVLKLWGVASGDATAVAISQHSQSLKKLKLQSGISLTDTGLLALLASPQLHQLEKLIVHNAKLSVASLDALAKRAPSNLHLVKLGHIQVDEEKEEVMIGLVDQLKSKGFNVKMLDRDDGTNDIVLTLS